MEAFLSLALPSNTGWLCCPDTLRNHTIPPQVAECDMSSQVLLFCCSGNEVSQKPVKVLLFLLGLCLQIAAGSPICQVRVPRFM